MLADGRSLHAGQCAIADASHPRDAPIYLAVPDGRHLAAKLPGLSDRHSDFMWVAAHGTEVFPILIEIEAPHKRWFYGDRAEIHSDLAHAQGQLAEWRAWFDAGYNRDLFIDQYGLRSFIEDRKLSPRFVLIHGQELHQ